MLGFNQAKVEHSGLTRPKIRIPLVLRPLEVKFLLHLGLLMPTSLTRKLTSVRKLTTMMKKKKKTGAAGTICPSLEFRLARTTTVRARMCQSPLATSRRRTTRQ